MLASVHCLLITPKVYFPQTLTDREQAVVTEVVVAGQDGDHLPVLFEVHVGVVLHAVDQLPRLSHQVTLHKEKCRPFGL